MNWSTLIINPLNLEGGSELISVRDYSFQFNANLTLNYI